MSVAGCNADESTFLSHDQRRKPSGRGRRVKARGSIAQANRQGNTDASVAATALVQDVPAESWVRLVRKDRPASVRSLG